MHAKAEYGPRFTVSSSICNTIAFVKVPAWSASGFQTAVVLPYAALWLSHDVKFSFPFRGKTDRFIFFGSSEWARLFAVPFLIQILQMGAADTSPWHWTQWVPRFLENKQAKSISWWNSLSTIKEVFGISAQTKAQRRKTDMLPARPDIPLRTPAKWETMQGAEPLDKIRLCRWACSIFWTMGCALHIKG